MPCIQGNYRNANDVGWTTIRHRPVETSLGENRTPQQTRYTPRRQRRDPYVRPRREAGRV